MSEHSVDDPVGPEGSAGEHEADDTVTSEETGTRYRSDGTPAATPEDEERLLEEQEDEG
jgi:hypothetical protein